MHLKIFIPHTIIFLLIIMADFYISSNKYSLQERQTKRGRVYDVVFRIISLDGIEKQKKLSGYSSKSLAKQAYLDFITNKCELVKNNPIKKRKTIADGKDELTVENLIPLYIAAMSNQNKDSTIYDRKNTLYNFILPYFQKTKSPQSHRRSRTH